jgi:condensin complex subunit 2
MTTTTSSSAEQLGELYKQAIRMNAENRINASNSWNLALIENIDQFLLLEEEEEEEQHEDLPRDHRRPENDKNRLTLNNAQPTPTPRRQRVNFTKASCTLDASVKIYSYRVDDVHLSSYKVLANLNRNDQNANHKNADSDNDKNTHPDPDHHNAGNHKKSTHSSTLETNMANINLNKLDAAFDIDPLFHKMSKTFDEGGAKGLLLANLGVSSHGCNVVFDSTSNDSNPVAEEKTEDDRHVNETTYAPVDISSLRAKLEALVNTNDPDGNTGGTFLEDLALVPQLTSLRAEHDRLAAEGFVLDDNPTMTSTKDRGSQRYAPTADEETQADQSIHQEALERSRRTNKSFLSETDQEYEEIIGSSTSQQPPQSLSIGYDDADDFGGGFDDGDDDDAGFDDFLQRDQQGARYSSISFSGSVQNFQAQEGASDTDVPTSTALLEALLGSQALTDQDQYRYFDAELLSSAVHANNAWAGATHWKRTPKVATTTGPSVAKTKSQRKKPRALVDLTATACLDDVLRSPPKTSSLSWSQAIVQKYTNAEHSNLLPPDAEMDVETLSTLFLRPQSVCRGLSVAGGGDKVSTPKAVGFNMGGVETFGWDDGHDDDGEGGGYDFGGDDDDDMSFVAPLEDIRKVDKVHVGYATVAKKVDVKRLKKDLWIELEAKLAEPAKLGEHKDHDADDSSMSLSDAVTPSKPSLPLSFQKAVQDLEATKTQADVTLPFYFICILHLANEKGLRLDSHGLEDFGIVYDAAGVPLAGV